jgi:hypothetical protein
MPRQVVMVRDTAADTDALQGTDLERAPGPGLIEIWPASTVDTATLTLVVGGENIVRNQVIPLRANGVPNVSDDPPAASAPVGGGEKIVVNLGGTTGTIHTKAVFTPEDEL